MFSLLCCLLCYISEGQIFVNDVERVAIVVIDYCVDSSGNRYNLTINDEKSTYKDKDWQYNCMTHFEESRLMYPEKMGDQCWQAVYYFVNPKYKTYELPAAERAKCKDLHKGEFKYESPAYNQTRIIRRKHKQLELNPEKDQRQVYDINWLDDHVYTLKALKLPLAKDDSKIGRTIKVEIIELLNDSSYLYRASESDDDPNVVYGVITKVK